jgi:cyclopropane fatty-acyl-phospholipid synthase-like methyltransferase
MLAIHSQQGRSFGPIHPADFMIEFLLQNPSTKERAVDSYVECGQHSAQYLRDLLRFHCRVRNPTILEFAAGYGCMTRHMKEHFPAARVTACDIHEMAVTFLRDAFGVATVLSAMEPEQLSIPSKFDVVCAVSFFAHLPNETWSRWLKALVDHTASGGLMIFTTHGSKSAARHVLSANEDGFAFAPVSEQGDLDLAQYGTALTTFDYVYRQIRDIGSAHLIHFHEALWWGHQDAYVLEKVAAA